MPRPTHNGDPSAAATTTVTTNTTEGTAPTSILKATSAYSSELSTDAQFFNSQEIASAPTLTPTEVEAATAEQRGDYQEDDYDDPDGSLWAGPVARSIPTSMSGFRMRNRSRSELDRASREFVRASLDEAASERPSFGDDGTETEDDGQSIARRSSRSKRSRRPPRKCSSRSSRSAVLSETEGEMEGEQGDDTDAASQVTSRRSSQSKSRPRRRRRKSVTSNRSASMAGSDQDDDQDEHARSGFFQGISNALRGRPLMLRLDSTTSRKSVSASAGRRSTDVLEEDAVSLRSESDYAGDRFEDDNDDPYGPYGGSSDSVSTSSTLTSSSQDEGGPRRRRGAGGLLGVLPGGGGDAFYGESRIEFASDAEDDEDEFSTDDEDDERRRKAGGLQASQSVYIPDEDLPLRLLGLHVSRWRVALWTLGCILTGGALWLLGRWLPKLWLKSVGKPGEFRKASYVVVECFHHEPQILPIETFHFSKPLALSTAFPPSLVTPPAHRDDVAHPRNSSKPIDEGASETDTGVQTPSSTPPAVTPAGAAQNEAVPIAFAGQPPNATGQNATNHKGKKAKGPAITQLQYLDYRYYRFLLHPEGEFRMVREWKDPTWTTLLSLRKGLSSTDAHTRQSLFGQNSIDIKARGIVQLLMDEVLHPFYIFQIFSIALWCVDDYYYYAFAIAIISVASIISTLIETKGNIERMREMSRFSCPVKVLRDSEWTSDVSDALVPGDIVDLSDASLNTFPADSVLLSGDAIVNESMLTGESVPVSKYPVEPAGISWISAPGGDVSPDLSRHVVFSGTKIIRIRKTSPISIGGGEPEALAMVVRTGFNTTKGALVRSMLFPKPFGFAFYRDSFRFIGVLAIVAVLGFMASSVNFIKLGISWSVIVIRALDLVTIVVPPALPATMSIGTSFAISRLRKIGIFCISPSRVNIGGKVNIVCFDKTGTLTEEGLDVLGVRSVVRSTNKFADLEHDADNVPIFGAADAKTPLLHALATCHALKIVDGEVIGDPLDLRMFDFTHWTLEEGKEAATTKVPTTDAAKHRKHASSARAAAAPGSASSKVPERAATLVQTVVRPPGGESFKLEDALKAGSKHAHFLELGVLRTFDFVSSLRRMSVLVKKLKSTSVEAYVKGAPEVMLEICNKTTLPDDYEEMLAYYTKHGFRVIALAGKSMPGLTWIKAQRLKREVVESDLRFLGIIVFENKLKPGTAPAIATLRAAHIPTRMVTGDNVRTAISVGRECGMFPGSARVYLPTFLKGNSSTPRSTIEWIDVDDESRKLDPYSLLPVVTDDDRSSYSGYSDERSRREYHLAISGDVFRWMMDFGALETLQRMLVKGIIFARMSPDEKHELVERLQSLGYTVGFCGDGANDCGALKAADVGLSLSEAEASVAASFTSRQPDIRCFVEVIKEGRAALVTSFSCFKFMALYSLIQFTTVTLLYSIASTLGDFQFLYIDLFLILPIAVTMGRTEAFPRVHPKRPTASLISKKVLTSLIGQIALAALFQSITFFFVRAQSWYAPPEIDPDELDIVSYENTALFLISSFQYVLVAFIFCVGPPYRKPLYSNRWLVAALVSLTVFSIYTLFTTSGPIFALLQLVSLPHDFHLEMLLMLIANTAACWTFEEYGASRLTKLISEMQRKWRRARGTRRRDDGKVYKAVQRAMED
ncbi:BQ2448_7404 [Microbotryum intermedium]|uniref:Cation-transporting ATPase n=1 Tax=Microbotryum intermedium TaxID=269621 RepID=A0A238FQK0_9BASI|nr:BQ2448_7404 [Microbotryum intermedium]